MRLRRLIVVTCAMVILPCVSVFAEDTASSMTENSTVTTKGLCKAEDNNSDSDGTMTRMSGSDRFCVSMRSNVYPVPLSQIHSWVLHLETPEGVAIDDAQIGVYGDMPAHRHGLPTKPKVTKNRGGGDYLIEGVKFTMPGRWQLILIITADGKRDKAKFNVDLP